MKLYLAGGHRRSFREAVLELGGNKLYSYRLERREAESIMADARTKQGYRLMVDSGAHSWNKLFETRAAAGGVGMKRLPDAEMYHEEYLSWIEQRGDQAITVVEFDVYALLTEKVLARAHERVREAVSAGGGALRYIRVYHPRLDDGNLSTLRRWIDEGHTYVGVGRDSIPILNRIFDLTRDTVRIHGFAMIRAKYLERFPFYSADSSSVLAPAMYGGAFKTSNGRAPTFTSKQRLMRARRHEVLYSTDWRVREGVCQSVRYERFLTSLWAERGVVWED